MAGPLTRTLRMERAHEALANRSFDDLAQIMDTLELGSPNPQVLQEWPHAMHLLGHIYNKNWADARFLWKRIPAAVKQNNPELEAVWKLLQFFWCRHYQGIWQALQGYQWSPQLQPLVDALTAKTREDTLDLISTAYHTVRPDKVAKLVGLPQQEALQVCLAQGWQYDEATGMLTVVPKPAPEAGHDGCGNLQQLAEYMVHLEQ